MSDAPTISCHVEYTYNLGQFQKKVVGRRINKLPFDADESTVQQMMELFVITEQLMEASLKDEIDRIRTGGVISGRNDHLLREIELPPQDVLYIHKEARELDAIELEPEEAEFLAKIKAGERFCRECGRLGSVEFRVDAGLCWCCREEAAAKVRASIPDGDWPVLNPSSKPSATPEPLTPQQDVAGPILMVVDASADQDALLARACAQLAPFSTGTADPFADESPNAVIVLQGEETVSDHVAPFIKDYCSEEVLADLNNAKCSITISTIPSEADIIVIEEESDPKVEEEGRPVGLQPGDLYLSYCASCERDTLGSNGHCSVCDPGIFELAEDQPQTEFSAPDFDGSMPSPEDETSIGETSVNLAIPSEADLITIGNVYGIPIEIPPAEWFDQPITNKDTASDGSAGQLVALHAALGATFGRTTLESQKYAIANLILKQYYESVGQ